MGVASQGGKRRDLALVRSATKSLHWFAPRKPERIVLYPLAITLNLGGSDAGDSGFHSAPFVQFLQKLSRGRLPQLTTVL
jgi:hypothetical protein